MKFPRNARVFRGNFDIVPYISVLFLLVMFVLIGSLVYTPGVSLSLPRANDLPGTDKPSVKVALDSEGRIYFENQLVDRARLQWRLRSLVEVASEPLTVVIIADNAVQYGNVIQLSLLARETGIDDVILAVLPGMMTEAAASEE